MATPQAPIRSAVAAQLYIAETEARAREEAELHIERPFQQISEPAFSR